MNTEKQRPGGGSTQKRNLFQIYEVNNFAIEYGQNLKTSFPDKGVADYISGEAPIIGDCDLLK